MTVEEATSCKDGVTMASDENDNIIVSISAKLFDLPVAGSATEVIN